MFKKILIAAVFAVTPMVLSDESSAGDCYYGGGYRAAVPVYRAPVPAYRGHHHHGSYRQVYSVPFPSHGRTHYGSGYGSRYNSGYRHGYGGYGGPYYGRRGSGISVTFGF